MTLKTTPDAAHAIDFLSWFFGEKPDGFIYVLRQRPSSDPMEARQGKLEVRPASFSRPEKIDNSFWSEQGHLWGMVFCTATTRTREEKSNQLNTVSIPALWVDIDGCKELGIPGDEFYGELKDTEEVSCFTRSSKNGIQAFFKLDEPFEVNGDKELFKETIAPILWDMMLYYGGDDKVVRLGNLMRLPGSLNVKPEYDTHYMAQARIYRDNVYTLKELRNRFKTDPDIVPRLVLFAVNRALADIYDRGNRHDLHLYLAGTVRKAGINRGACENLCKEVCQYYGDQEVDDRLTAVATTYENPMEGVATLYSEYPEVHEAVDEAVAFWVKLKKIYCKKRGFEFIPENYDPTAPQAPDGDFIHRDLQTWYNGADGQPAIFSNFIVELKGKVVKADTHQTSWLACIKKQGDQPTVVEIPAEKLSTWQKFNTDVPVGLSVLVPALWNKYIAWLDTTCPPITMLESRMYGILDADKGKPTLLLPGIPHENYVWTGGEDTARPEIYARCPTTEDAIEYLDKFARYYANFHEPRFIWPSLGWFAGAMISELIWQKQHGFPILQVCGLSGSGKTDLFEHILGPHFGHMKVHSYPGTTAYAIRTMLLSNNICPFVLDEFRIDGRVQDDKKAKDLQAIVRCLFDRNGTASGTSSQKLVKGDFATPLCIIGESYYSDEACTQRSFTIRLNRAHLNHIKTLPLEEQRRLRLEREWLYASNNPDNIGKMGQIIIHWVGNNFDKVNDIISDAIAWVDATSPIRKVDRKFKTFVGIVAGHFLLKAIYKHYGLHYPLTDKLLRESLYTADTQLADAGEYDTETMRTLFEATDFAIMNALRQNTSLEGYVFTYDTEDRSIAYFDTGRWFRHLTGYGGNMSSAAALTDKTQFLELLKDHAGEENSPVMGFPNHPYFTKSCVQIDLSKVQERYGINIDQWKGVEGFEDV